jgi:hypothetical protein
MRLVLLIPTMYHTGVCNSVKANSQKSFVGHVKIPKLSWSFLTPEEVIPLVDIVVIDAR